MDAGWEDKFRTWSKPLGQTEADRCDNAQRMIRRAIDVSEALRSRNVRAFAQGSYRNNTNVRQNSDVDVCVLCTDSIFVDYTDGVTDAATRLEPATYMYSVFRNEVEIALKSYFGTDGVRRGNKAFDIHENTYRVDADVVACFEYRYYFRLPDGTLRCQIGTAFLPNQGPKVLNFPEQHYQEGVAKNEATSDRFKRVVRILKRIRGAMEEEGIPAAKSAPSFLIESLVWNTPNDYFGHDQYAEDVRRILIYIYRETSSEDKCKDWTEVNGLKYLFRPSQPWTRQQANSFAAAVWSYVGFKS